MATQSIAGAVSGWDTTAIIEQLMNIERSQYDKTSEKVQAEKVKLQAYQSINTMLSSFSDAVSTLSSSALWNAKTTSSSNESSLTATATQYAVEGSYSFRVGQLASSAQYLSKGYASETSTVIPSNSSSSTGTIVLESSKARVDNSAKLEELNGGAGIYRGSIRITDGAGTSTTVDLSTCETIDQILKQINSAAGVQIEASFSESGSSINITDLSGGTGALKIQNVGQGTTATDLGIAGSASPGTDIVGTSIYGLSSTTSLSNLRDGQGIEEGIICITVAEGGSELDIAVDLNGLSTVGDVLKKVNSTIQEAAKNNSNFADLENLELAINSDGNGLTFNGGKAGVVYTISEVWMSGEFANPETAEQLGLSGTYKVSTDGDSFGGSRLIGDLTSPMLSSLSGANLNGIGSESSVPKVSVDTLDRDTLLSNLNGGDGISVGNGNAFEIKFYEAGGDSFRYFSDLFDENQLRAMALDSDATLGDLVDYMNRSFANCGVPGLESVTVNIDSTGKGLYLNGLSDAHDYEFGGTLAMSLGLVFNGAGDAGQGYGAKIEGSASDPALDDLYSYSQLSESGKQITEATTLEQLYIGGNLIDQQQLDDMLVDGGLVLDIDGVAVTVDLSELTGDSTIEQLINTINEAIYNQVKAHDPDMSCPFLAIEYNSTGLNWRNVDLDSDFSASGNLAATLGIDKNYTGQSYGASATSVQKNLNPVTTGVATAVDLTGTETLSSLNAGSGLSLTGNSLTLTFGADGGNQSIVSISRDELIAALGGNYGSATLDQYIDALNGLFAQKISEHVDLGSSGASFTLAKSADGTGITIGSVTGTAADQKISLGGDMAKASSTGFNTMNVTIGSSESPEVADIRSVDVAEEKLSGLGYINLEIGGTSLQLNTDGLDRNSTLNELLNTLNKQLSAAGYSDISFGVSDSGSGIALNNGSSSSVTIKYDEFSSLASDLGLVGKIGENTDTKVSANSHQNGSSLNRNYVSRSTLLSTLNNGQGADLGVIQLTNAQGTSSVVDLQNCLTMGDVIDAINGSIYGMKARINDAGDGIIIEQTDDASTTNATGVCTGNIKISSYDGSKTAEHLGIAGTGKGGETGMSSIDGSFKTVIEVGPNDTLTDIRNRISNLDAGYKTSIINDGTGSNSYRLSITSASSGAAYDFIIDTDIEALTMQQVTKGQDGMVLYGQPDSGVSPIALKSSTNSNNQAILGLTLELNDVSESYTTITVSKDTSKVVEAFETLVSTYNDLSDLITYCDSYQFNSETGESEKGILFGDSSIRQLMDSIDDMFYQVYNPNNLSYSTIASSATKSTWTWMDLGISFTTNNTAEDGESGSYYSRMELDTDALSEMISSSWDTLSAMMSGTRNASTSNASANVAATATFSYKYDLDENGKPIYPEGASDPNTAISGDKSSGSDVFTANKTIEEGENTYTIYFQQAANIDRISIYHPNSSDMPASEYALSDFTVEYLDATTGKWVTEREISGNTGSSTILGLTGSPSVLGIRITASGTNAEDGKFRLLDVQCLEATGLAASMNQTVKSLTDVVDGWYVSVYENTEGKITSLQENMAKMQEKLDAKEARLWKQFNAMESALAKLQSQGDTLTSMLGTSSSS